MRFTCDLSLSLSLSLSLFFSPSIFFPPYFSMRSAPLSVFLEPDTQTVDVGKEIIFRCRILGSPVTHVHWIHDGNLLKMGGRFSLLSKDMLRIESVHRSDRGMYQCLVKNERESAQASALLKIGGKRQGSQSKVREEHFH